MKYFIDTEFIEGKQDKTFLGVKYGETKPTIDLISIGIVREIEPKEYLNTLVNSYEYYAISKDFNLKAAWNNKWVRENVLLQIHNELVIKFEEDRKQTQKLGIYYMKELTFSKSNLKYLLNKYGKTNKQIAQEIIEFTGDIEYSNAIITHTATNPSNIEFYGYYSDYDWVVFCQLFGTMMDLPKGFPMYCKDLKQELDNYINEERVGFKKWKDKKDRVNDNIIETFNYHLEKIQSLPNYPKQTNEHNALADAKWNYELYKFLNKI